MIRILSWLPENCNYLTKVCSRMCGLLVIFLVLKKLSSSRMRKIKRLPFWSLAETNGDNFTKLPLHFHVFVKPLVSSESDDNPDWCAMVVFCSIDPVTPARVCLSLTRNYKWLFQESLYYLSFLTQWKLNCIGMCDWYLCVYAWTYMFTCVREKC